MNPNLSQLKKRANTLPTTPGVYIMRDSADKIIYIGKAKSLKNRVTQYFGSNLNHSTKVRKMVENVNKFDFILCDSEFEAFLLENSLIKQHQPKYNILLKDDKGFHYIKITDEKWKKIIAVKQKNDNAQYIGPYNSGYIVKQTVDEALKIFKLPTCNRSFDKRTKPCLNFHIGLCDAPCKANMTLEQYNETVKSAVEFIKKGGIAEGEIDILRQKMETASENLDFELAAKLRDRINAINRVRERQKVITTQNREQDVIASVTADDQTCVQILRFSGGHLSDQVHFIINDSDTNRDLFYYEFLQQFYNNDSFIPTHIYIDSEVCDAELLERLFSDIKGKKVSITVPKMGEQQKLIDMCRTNAAQNLSTVIKRSGKETSALSELGELLGIAPPKYIEAYDISNFAGSQNVAGMVVFFNGRPLKSNYRRFKIKEFSGQDDYRSMQEILRRRLNEYKKGEDEAFSRLPDLILLDGAKGQINAVLPVLQEFNIEIPVFGMVKDSKHRTRAISSSGGDIAIKSTRKVFTLVTTIQDEVHRFAISYNRNMLKRVMLESELTKIGGIGKSKAGELLKKFKTVQNIKSATVAELCTVKGISQKIAENIKNYYEKSVN